MYIFNDVDINGNKRLMFSTVVVVHKNTTSCAENAVFSTYKSEECQAGCKPDSSVLKRWRVTPMALVRIQA